MFRRGTRDRTRILLARPRRTLGMCRSLRSGAIWRSLARTCRLPPLPSVRTRRTFLVLLRLRTRPKGTVAVRHLIARRWWPRPPPPQEKLPYAQKALAMEQHPGRPLEPQQRDNLHAGKPAGPMMDKEFPPHSAPPPHVQSAPHGEPPRP